MEDKETLLFEVVFDAPKVQERVELLSHVIAQLRKEKQATEKDFKKGVVGAEEYAKSIQSIDTQLVKAQTDFKETSKQLAGYEKAQKAAAGSVDEMRAKVALLIPAYTALSKEERENEKTGKLLQAQIKALNDELKATESSYGDNRRAIGSYAEAIEKAISGNATFVGKLRETKESFSEAFATTKTYVTGLRVEISVKLTTSFQNRLTNDFALN